MSPNARRRTVADMGLRVDVIADTGWAAEGLAVALQRGAHAVAGGAIGTPDAIIVRAAPLDRWLGEAPGPNDSAPELGELAELVIALLPDASSGARLLQRLPAHTPVLWLHSIPHAVMAIDAVPDRPTGRLPVDASDAQLFIALSALAYGLSVSLPEAIHTQHIVAPAAPALELVEPLTARELEVLELMAKGLANRDIADALGISSHTAKFHVAQILDKTGSATRTEAVRQGLRLGLIGL
jgi:DNA-binding NarL/FixJ family response regulator